jgi:protein tyrosine phosphatase (PTP) superfamily phosphohydrolase (DUF442 family)
LKLQRSAYLRSALVLGIVLVTVAESYQGRDERRQPEATAKSRPAPERLPAQGVENLYRLSPRLYSGGQPEGAKGFTALKALGVRTILSVDGATPDVETARQLGLRYVHLPVGYDGVPREQALRMIQAVRTLPGPVFVHCHHGKHRGPTAAALCGLATEGWGNEQALAWMNQAGTSPDYRGLFASVEGFTVPSPTELARVSNDFPERAKVPGLVETMVQVDATWDRLKAVREAGFRAPPGHADVDPSHEALQLAEHFRESLRLPETRAKGEAFRREMESSVSRATALEGALRAWGEGHTEGARRAAEAAFREAEKSCTACHARFRDGRSS